MTLIKCTPFNQLKITNYELKDETPMTKIEIFDTQTNDYNSTTYQIINR